MTDPLPEKPRRRPRYSGKNPRQFHEKYKEHQPERYAADVEKVLASGKTPAGTHRSIMVREIMEILAPRPGELAIDATLGYGGHAKEILAKISPGGRLLGLDPLPCAVAATVAVELAGVVAGGNFWDHYLIALIPTVSLIAGLSVNGRVPGAGWTRRLVVLAAIMTALGSPLAQGRNIARTFLTVMNMPCAARSSTPIQNGGLAIVARFASSAASSGISR